MVKRLASRPLMPNDQAGRRPVYKAKFVKLLSEGHTVTSAARSLGIGPVTAYNWRRDDEAFAKEWADAIEEGIDKLELEARRRAMESSDKLLQFLLTSYRPTVFRQTPAAVQVNVNTAPEVEDNRPPLLSLIEEGVGAAMAQSLVIEGNVVEVDADAEAD